MLKDVTLGQFFPGSSIVHRLDPRCKLLLTIIYIAALFTAQSYVSYAVMLIVTGVCIALSRIPLKVILRGLKPLWIIIALTAVLNIFFTPGVSSCPSGRSPSPMRASCAPCSWSCASRCSSPARSC